MTLSSKAFLTASILVLSGFVPAASGEDRTARTIVVSDGGDDTIEVEAPRALPRVRVFRDGGSRLGVQLLDITPELRTHFGAPKDAGVLVATVEKDSPASRAGIEVGDVVTSVDGDKVESPGELARAIRRKSGGETVALEVVRKGASKKLTAKVEERPHENAEILEIPGREFGRDLEREIRRGLRGVRPFVWDFDHDGLRALPSEDVRKLRERLDRLERRLKDLEGRKSR